MQEILFIFGERFGMGIAVLLHSTHLLLRRDVDNWLSDWLLSDTASDITGAAVDDPWSDDPSSYDSSSYDSFSDSGESAEPDHPTGTLVISRTILTAW